MAFRSTDMVDEDDDSAFVEYSLSLSDALDGKRIGTEEWIELFLFDVDPAKRIEVKSRNAEEKRFAIYARYSTSGQKQSSLKRQRDICEYYVNLMGGLTVAYFEDRGKSAATAAGRAGLLEMLERLHEFDGIVVEDFDRFSREIYDAMEIQERLERDGVELHSAIDERPMTKEDIAQAAVRAERDRIRRRNLTQAGLTELVAAGGLPNGACFGYRESGRRGFPIPDDVQKLVVQKIMLLASQNVPFNQIAQRLNADGDLPPSRAPYWSARSVAAIVSRPIYTGRILYRRTVKLKERKTLKVSRFHNSKEMIDKNYNERYRIVSDELFAAANRGRRKKGRPARQNSAGLPAKLFGRSVCDCPGVVGQIYSKTQASFGRISCNLGVKKASCSADVHSVNIEAIERAVVDAVVKDAESYFIEVDFRHYYRQRITEHIEQNDYKATSVERELDEALALRQRTFQKELREGWSGEAVVENRREIEKQIVDLRAIRRRLSEIRVELLSRLDRCAEISTAFSELGKRLPFVVKTEADAEFVRMFRRLVPELQIQRHERPAGQANVVMKVVWDALLTEDEEALAESQAVFLQSIAFLDNAPVKESAQLALENLAASGAHALTDEQWSIIADSLPDLSITEHGHRRGTDTRTVVDALIFQMTTGHLWTKMPKLFGDQHQIYSAVVRLVYAGGIEKLHAQLGVRYPELVARWGMQGVANMRRADVRSKAPRAIVRADLVARRRYEAGEHRLEERQWDAVRGFIDHTVAVPFARERCRIDERTVLELILLKLRTGCSWRKVPLGDFEYREFHFAVARVVYSGTWDRVVSIWRRDFPALLQGVDTSGMDAMLRSKRSGRIGEDGSIGVTPPTAAQKFWNPDGVLREISPEDWKDLSECEWSVVCKVLKPLSRKRHRLHINGILFALATRTRWTRVPARFGNHTMIYYLFRDYMVEDQGGSSMMKSILTALETNSPQTLVRMGRNIAAGIPTQSTATSPELAKQNRVEAVEAV